MIHRHQGLYSLSDKTSNRQIPSRSHKIGCYNDLVALKFDRHLGSWYLRRYKQTCLIDFEIRSKFLWWVGREVPSALSWGWQISCHALRWMHLTGQYELQITNHSLCALCKYCTVKYQSQPPGALPATTSNTTTLQFKQNGRHCTVVQITCLYPSITC